VARGVDTLYVRAAMDALARVAPDSAIDAIAPMLAHPSQDVRAGAARALGATGRDAAEPVLRARLATETVEQVRVAIADALRLLEGTAGTKEEP
jgi:HEAT repeat protein